jgi:hypothetical protein
MNNAGTMASMIEEAMSKQDGGKDRFTMTGQYASPVMYDEETGREFVIYEAPDGDEVKVFGKWGEWVAEQDEDGNGLISDEDYPIRRNEDGEFVLDVEAMESGPKSGDQGMIDQGMQQEAEGLAMGDDAAMMEQMMMMRSGGKVKSYAGGGYMKPRKRGY